MVITIKRGDIWYVRLDPTIGSEIRKTRPCVVISSDTAGKLPLRLVVPLTEWKDAFNAQFWQVRIEPTTENGLTKISAADTLQVRGVDIARFVPAPTGGASGKLAEETLREITVAIALTIDHASHI